MPILRFVGIFAACYGGQSELRINEANVEAKLSESVSKSSFLFDALMNLFINYKQKTRVTPKLFLFFL
jgi:hypothetical protein